MDQAHKLRAIIKAERTKEVRPKARVITVTSGKGGVGKSNTAINLAVQLRKRGRKAIILDADFGLANIEIMFGTRPKYSLSDLIRQRKNINDIITMGPGDVGFISGGSGIVEMANMSRDDLVYIIQNLAQLDAIADIVIVDTGAGIADTVMEFLVASGEILLVTTPEPTSITDAYSLLKALGQHPRFSPEDTRIKMVANRVEKPGDGKLLYEKLNRVVNSYLKVPLTYVGAVPHDQQVAQAVMEQKPVSLSASWSKAAKAYSDLADALLEGENESAHAKRGMAAFFSALVSGRKIG